MQCTLASSATGDSFRSRCGALEMALRPSVVRDQDKVEVRLTEEAEYRIPFTFIEALNEGTLFDRPAHAFLEAARERRLFHVLNRTTDNIIGTGIIQGSGDEKSTTAKVVEQLMGNKPEERFKFISRRAEFVSDEALDV